MIGYLTQNHPLIAAFAPRAERRTRREAVATGRLIRSAPKLGDYFRDGEIDAIRGTLDQPISGLAIDSRRVLPGAVFFALPGRSPEAPSGIAEAVSRGAVAVVSSRLPVLPPARVTFLQVANVRAALESVARRYYGLPDRAMTVVGVAGGRGKTSVAHLLKHLLNGDQPVGLLGSIHHHLGNRTVPAFPRPPEALEVYGLLAQMREAGCRQAVVEFGPHGLDASRLPHLQRGATVFAPTMADAAVGAVDEGAGAGRGAALVVVHLDGAANRARAAVLAERGDAKVITYGEDPAAQVRAEEIAAGGRGTRFRMVWPGGALVVDSPLWGRHNVANLLAAVATAWGLGRDPSVILARLRTFAGVPGRLERIDEGQAAEVVIDSAATSESLRHVLGVLRARTAGRLIVVFGAAGEQDPADRPALVRAVQAGADFAVATAVNPRGEPLAQIFSQMRAGVTAPERLAWIEDRRDAIQAALDVARQGDCVLVAGKGHESYQELAGTVAPFDDRQVVRELMRNRKSEG